MRYMSPEVPLSPLRSEYSQNQIGWMSTRITRYARNSSHAFLSTAGASLTSFACFSTRSTRLLPVISDVCSGYHECVRLCLRPKLCIPHPVGDLDVPTAHNDFDDHSRLHGIDDNILIRLSPSVNINIRGRDSYVGKTLRSNSECGLDFIQFGLNVGQLLRRQGWQFRHVCVQVLTNGLQECAVIMPVDRLELSGVIIEVALRQVNDFMKA